MMKLPVKIIIALIVATATAFAFNALVGAQLPFFALWFAFAVACVASALIASWTPSPEAIGAVSPAPAPKKAGAAPNKAAPARQKPAAKPSTGGGERETGTVKWFNGSKGFGFIVKDDGEEIFVHFRSIVGEGRRSLRDGQSVTFVVAQSDKGPQAEAVEAVD
tara:strand:+ start:216593 stop:217081 length:489 start_codon:yes stop_codon:yes gene_type:complete